MLLSKVFQVSLLLASLASNCVSAGTDDHSMVEWKGIFDTPENSYVWIAQKVDGGYADPTMKLVALPVDSASEESLEGVEEDGEDNNVYLVDILSDPNSDITSLVEAEEIESSEYLRVSDAANMRRGSRFQRADRSSASSCCVTTLCWW